MYMLSMYNAEYFFLRVWLYLIIVIQKFHLY